MYRLCINTEIYIHTHAVADELSAGTSKEKKGSSFVMDRRRGNPVSYTRKLTDQTDETA